MDWSKRQKRDGKIGERSKRKRSECEEKKYSEIVNV